MVLFFAHWLFATHFVALLPTYWGCGEWAGQNWD
jgi:hypothetical protein